MARLSTVETLTNAITLHQQGMLNAAEALYREALAREPTQLDALRNLGVLLLQSARVSEAINLLTSASRTQSRNFAILEVLADFYQQIGADEAAVTALTRAARLAPDSGRLQHKLGLVYDRRRQLPSALEHYRRAASLSPSASEYHYRLAGALRGAGRFDEAISSYERALSLAPEAVETLLDYAGTLRLLLRDEQALPLYKQAVTMRPDFALAHNNLGNVLFDIGQFDDAITSLERAAQLGLALAFGNLGSSYMEVGRSDDAMRAFRHALTLNPEDRAAHSSFVFSMPFHPSYDQKAVLEEARSCCKMLERLPPRPEVEAHRRQPERRLKIGYVSPDFREHCQSFFTLPLLSNHDANEVDVYCYSSVLHPDDVTARLRAVSHHWREAALLDDVALASVIRADGIDILIDLTMHMARHRLAVFARRPAPLQVTWLAYPGTTGLSCIDYRLSDPYLDPPDADLGLYVEATHRLSHTFWCYDPLTADLEPGPLPAFARKAITYGCLNAFRKINSDVINVFARVLVQIEDSRLVLLCPKGNCRERVLGQFAHRGVDSARIELLDRMPRKAYLQAYQGIDICLDTFPYNGHTTSLDAWWMGVPVVTMLGTTIVGRAGLSQAANLDLGALVATSPDDFVRIAAQLAEDPVRLAALRAILRGRMQASPLMDGRAFARDVEAAFRSFWRDYCRQ